MSHSDFWTDAKIAELLRLRAEGVTQNETARRLGTSPAAVAHKVARLNLPRRPSPIGEKRPRRPWTPEEDAILRAHPDLGASRFGGMINRDKSAISQRRRVLGLAQPQGSAITPWEIKEEAPVAPTPRPKLVAPVALPPPPPIPRARECCWVEGERFQQRYCDAPVERGSFCSEHAAIAYARSAA